MWEVACRLVKVFYYFGASHHKPAVKEIANACLRPFKGKLLQDHHPSHHNGFK